MEELIEVLKRHDGESLELEACTILLKDADGYRRILVRSDFNGNVYEDEIP